MYTRINSVFSSSLIPSLLFISLSCSCSFHAAVRAFFFLLDVSNTLEVTLFSHYFSARYCWLQCYWSGFVFATTRKLLCHAIRTKLRASNQTKTTTTNKTEDKKKTIKHTNRHIWLLWKNVETRKYVNNVEYTIAQWKWFQTAFGELFLKRYDFRSRYYRIKPNWVTFKRCCSPPFSCFYGKFLVIRFFIFVWSVICSVQFPSMALLHFFINIQACFSFCIKKSSFHSFPLVSWYCQ